MKIDIDKYRITSSPTDYAIFEPKITPKGKHIRKDCSFYPNLAGVFNDLLNRQIKESTATTLQELLKEYKQTKKEIFELWEGVK